ncbi:12904_t:CDS:1, partial [Racocetra persica]
MDRHNYTCVVGIISSKYEKSEHIPDQELSKRVEVQIANFDNWYRI